MEKRTEQKKLIGCLLDGIKSRNLGLGEVKNKVDQIIKLDQENSESWKKWSVFKSFLSVERIEETLEAWLVDEEREGYAEIYNSECPFSLIIETIQEMTPFNPKEPAFTPLVCLIGDKNINGLDSDEINKACGVKFDRAFIEEIKNQFPEFYRDEVGSSPKWGARVYDCDEIICDFMDDFDSNELDENDAGKCIICVKDPAGLHLRPTNKLVNYIIENSTEEQKIYAEAKGKRVNAKSIISVLSLGIQQGEKITIDWGNSTQAETMRLMLEI